MPPKGMEGFDPALIPTAITDYSTRSALIATGGCETAFSALLKTARGITPDLSTPQSRLEVFRGQPDILRLLTFTLSSDFFDARELAYRGQVGG